MIDVSERFTIAYASTNAKGHIMPPSDFKGLTSCQAVKLSIYTAPMPHYSINLGVYTDYILCPYHTTI